MKHRELYKYSLQHIAASLSYAKDIIAGHDYRSELDYRPNLLRELLNAECILKDLDNKNFFKIFQYRKELQKRQITIILSDVDKLRELFLELEGDVKKSLEEPCEKSLEESTTTIKIKKDAEVLSPPAPYPKYAKPLDIVLPLGCGSKNDNLELRFCLRSIENYIKNIGNIYIMSCHAPDWLQNVTVVPVPDRHKKNKDANLIEKVLTACDLPELSNNFLRFSDDQICLNDWDALDAVPIHNVRNPESMTNNKWQCRLNHTWSYLVDNGIVIDYNWDSHVPQPYNKKKFKKLVANSGYEILPGFCINTLYFGLLKETPRIVQGDVKVVAEKSISEKKFKKLSYKQWLGYNDKGFTSELKEYLFEKFPDKSKYEKY